MNKFRDLSIGVFFIVATACIVVVTFKVERVVGKLNTTLTMTSAAAQQLQSTLKSQKEQLDEPDVVKARKDSQLQFAELAKHLSQVTIKKFDQNLNSLNEATKSMTVLSKTVNDKTETTFEVVNNEILPSVGKTVEATNRIAESLNLSQAEVNSAIVGLINTGKTTTEIVNQRLLDPKFDELLAGALKLQDGALEIERDSRAVLGKVEAIGANLDEATKPLGTMVRSAQRWQRPLRVAQLVAILAGIFSP